MALLLIEGFENMNDVRDLYISNNLTGVTFDTSVARAIGGTALKMASGYGIINMQFPATDVLYIGFGMYVIDSTPIIAYSFCRFMDVDTEQCDIHLMTDGKLAVYRASTQLGITASAVITDNTWHYIEAKITIANTLGAGGIEIKVDGVSVLTINSGDSQASSVAACNSVSFIGHTNSQPRYDDIYVCDDAGAVNNTFLGQPYVKTLSPTGNGNTNQFVGVDADSTDNYLQVDDGATPDDDTTYAESGTLNDIDQYNFADMPNATTVHGVAVVALVRNTSGGDAVKAKPSIRSNSTDYLGTEFAAPITYVGIQEVFQVDPATSSLWAKAAVDAANFGLKITG